MKATIYTKENCPYCTYAKNLLNQRSIEYTEILMGRDISREDFFDKFPTVKTVPQIILTDLKENNSVHVGGYTDLVAYLDDNA